MGFLFGIKNKGIKITKAMLYKGGIRTRSSIGLNPNRMKNRGTKIASRIGKEFLGTYHAHVEEAGKISYGLSVEDKQSYIEDAIIVGLIITIWATDNSRKLIPGSKRLLVIKRFGNINYRYIISGYLNTPKGPRLIKTIKV
jgi:hypothetical protein